MVDARDGQSRLGESTDQGVVKRPRNGRNGCRRTAATRHHRNDGDGAGAPSPFVFLRPRHCAAGKLRRYWVLSSMLPATVQATIRKFSMIAPGERVLVGLSGGA